MSAEDRRPLLNNPLGLWTKDQGKGLWKPDQLQLLLTKPKDAVQSKDAAKSKDAVLLQQTLKQASQNFYQPTELKLLADATIRKDATDVAKKDTMQRVTVHLGTREQHEKNFSNIKKAPNPPYKTFKEMLAQFYNQLFSVDESTHVDKVMENETILHIVVYNRVRVKHALKNKNIQYEFDMVVGAASFMFAPSSCLLNYLGVTRFKFDSSPASIAKSLRDVSLKTTMQRSYKLGTFLLCCVQRVTYMFLETFDVIAEVNVSNTQGAYLFYRKNFFITPFVGEAIGEKIKEQKKVNKHYIDGTSM